MRGHDTRQPTQGRRQPPRQPSASNSASCGPHVPAA
jgi:hypothetical protein